MVAATYSKVVIDPKMMILLNWIDLCTEWEICESFKGINAHLEVSNKENSQAPGFRTEFGILYSLFYLCGVCFHDRPLTPRTSDFSFYSRKTWSYDYIYIIKKELVSAWKALSFQNWWNVKRKEKSKVHRVQVEKNKTKEAKFQELLEVWEFFWSCPVPTISPVHLFYCCWPGSSTYLYKLV